MSIKIISVIGMSRAATIQDLCDRFPRMPKCWAEEGEEDG